MCRPGTGYTSGMYIVSLTDTEYQALKVLISAGKGAARRLAHAGILLKPDEAIVEFVCFPEHFLNGYCPPLGELSYSVVRNEQLRRKTVAKLFFSLPVGEDPRWTAVGNK